MKTDRASRPKYPRRARIVLFICSCFVALLLGELLVRTAAPQPTYAFPQYLFENHPTRAYRLTPGVEGIVHTTEYKVPVRINSRGLRNSEVGERSPTRLRVLMLGDSFVMGYYSLEERSLVRLVERRLAERYGPVEIINAGVPSYGTVQELTFLCEEGEYYRPDVVVLAFCLSNDARDNANPERYEIVDGWRVREGKKPNLRSTFFRHSHLYRMVRFMLDDERVTLERRTRLYQTPQPETMTEAWQATDQALAGLVDECSRLSARLYVVAIPEMLQVYPDTWTRVQKDNPKFTLERDLPNRRLTELCARHGVPCLDLLPLLEKHVDERLYFETDPHWTPRGCELAGEIVGDWLAEELGRRD
ncbi:hypothetical protein HS125_06540 [bacterium]|nr:hypothetical protein [bacterium]